MESDSSFSGTGTVEPYFGMEVDGANPSTSGTAVDALIDAGGDTSDGKADTKPEGVNADGLKSSILTEVLNKKKMALLHSPEVTRFLQDQQRKKLKYDSCGS